MTVGEFWAMVGITLVVVGYFVALAFSLPMLLGAWLGGGLALILSMAPVFGAMYLHDVKGWGW